MSFSQNQNPLPTNSGISFTIDRWHGGSVILKNNDGHELPWPKDKLPATYKIGDQVELIINNNHQSRPQYEIMRKLLEELIN